MAENTVETVTILKVDTGEAVQSVNGLRSNIKILKDRLGELEIGSQEYQETLGELKVNQNALKDAMYASSASMDDLAAAATGTSETYNSLVHRMASLKEALRATDVSTESGKQRFKELADQVNEVNDRLKEMDAMQGNYQRNVGNYTSALTNLGDILKSVPPTLGSTKEQLGRVGETLGLIGKQPVLAIIGLIAPILMKITESLKDNETVLAAVDKAMAALQPIIDLIGVALQKVAEIVAKVIGYFTEMAGESGESFKKIIAGAVGVGNTILQFILTPARSAIAAIKGLGEAAKNLFKGQFKEAAASAGEAFKGIGEAFKKGFDFADNFKVGQEAGEKFAAGLGSTKKKAKDAAAEVAKAAEDGLKLTNVTDQMINATDATVAKRIEAQKAAAEEMKEINAAIQEDTDETMAYVDGVLGAIDTQQEQAVAAMAERMKQRQTVMQGVVSATSSILGSIADMYEANGDESVEQAERIKAMRIASATIDTISGAIAAYTGTIEAVPGPAGIILGAVQAAAVTAAGLAQIAQIRNTSVTGDSSGSTGSASSISSSGTTATSALEAVNAATGADAEERLNEMTATTSARQEAPGTEDVQASAQVQAPSTSPRVETVRNVTTESEERRADAAASPQRVYILASDLQAERNAARTRIAETSF